MSNGAAFGKRGRHFLVWALMYSLLWLMLSAGQGWYFAIPLVVVASLLSLALGLEPPRLHIPALLPFAGFFIAKLMAGGWDVAQRALRPSLPLAPGWVHYALRCQGHSLRLTLSALVGLLPGTYAARIDGDHLLIHVLDHRQPWRSVVAELERRLVALMGDPLLDGPVP